MARQRGVRLSDSIFVRALFLIALVMITVTAILTFNAIRVANGVAHGVVEQFGTEYTGLLARETAGAINFRRIDDIQAALSGTMERLGHKVDGAIAIGSDGEVLASALDPGANLEPLRQLAEEALRTNARVEDAAALTFAMPATFGQAGKAIGAVAVHWSAEALEADVRSQKFRAMAFAGAVVLVLLLGLYVFLRRMIAKPLGSIAAALGEIANGHYDVAIPHHERDHEIGVVARALETFRHKVSEADASTREAAFKGAGFDSSSACLMIADAEFNIVYANQAYMRLAEFHRTSMKHSVPNFDLEAVIGSNIDSFHKKPGMQRALLTALHEAHRAELEFGSAVFGLTVSPIDTPNDGRMGYVVEWKDITSERRNSAVLDTFETRQAMAEFSSDGTVMFANEVVARMTGMSEQDLIGRSLTDLVRTEQGEPLGAIDDARFGDFQMMSQTGEPGFFVGGLTPIRNKAGAVRCIILIGADVSAQRRAVQAADQEQARMRADQERAIEALRGGLANLSEGNLTLRLEDSFSDQHDQLRDDFNRALERMAKTISSVATKAGTIRSDVADISSAAEDLSRRTEHQAATLEETASALTQLTASVDAAADGARRANEIVAEARANAETSGVVVKNAVDAMGEIAESSTQISSIIRVIDDIAFQTNLLALNAGVEAARAGDAGRGFAVVASEVRALAQRSSEAAREINTLISASGEHVTRGVKLVGGAGSALEKIVSSVSDIADHVSLIAASAQEQSTGLAEINDAMNQLDQVTQQNAAMFEETTAATQALATAGNALGTAVGYFKTEAEGAASYGSEHRATRAPSPRPTGTGPATAAQTEDDLDNDWTDF